MTTSKKKKAPATKKVTVATTPKKTVVPKKVPVRAKKPTSKPKPEPVLEPMLHGVMCAEEALPARPDVVIPPLYVDYCTDLAAKYPGISFWMRPSDEGEQRMFTMMIEGTTKAIPTKVFNDDLMADVQMLIQMHADFRIHLR